MPWRILKQRSFPSKMIIIPKLLTDKAVLHSERGPAKCLCAVWGRVQFSITLLSDSKSLEKLQLGAASTKAGPKESVNHGFNHRESAKSDFVHLSLDLRKPSLCKKQNPFLPPWVNSPQKRLTVSAPFLHPHGCLYESQNSQAALPGVGCREEPLTSSDGHCLSASPQAQAQWSALRGGPFYTQVIQLAFLRRKSTGTHITHMPTCSGSLRNASFHLKKQSDLFFLFQASNDMSFLLHKPSRH